MTIVGSNLYDKASVLVEDAYCMDVRREGTDDLSCDLPAHTGGQNLSVVVMWEMLYSAPLPALTYAPPAVERISGCDAQSSPDGERVSGCPTTGNTTLTIHGANFGWHGAQVSPHLRAL